MSSPLHERLANEQYLPIMTERRKVKWLAELIGYRLALITPRSIWPLRLMMPRACP
ncbi:MAG: hypothetical protein R2867_26265 [Caldilineaceae bacterium]